ncbi:Cytadherence high molecular weight protein, putative [Entamoeba invadens IP1]|uniref:Cytadherence high molecular weight protein, putative n=1 Tax=Entamoeba invadens IP1 TaxID=370355 RepID=UPI0002C3D5E5|nr:Cytadherence high molecular weight protein, putative [Entamoeba invadens IP1]ELP93055.1 Cytadherence high molecular weight protein, putative [Entamoeba invadens IP1]|eukprot:XP_004259826.1 Cytadherence high molecular weight protein, putative [Entamoeba invadens IP1]
MRKYDLASLYYTQNQPPVPLPVHTQPLPQQIEPIQYRPNVSHNLFQPLTLQQKEYPNNQTIQVETFKTSNNTSSFFDENFGDFVEKKKPKTPREPNNTKVDAAKANDIFYLVNEKRKEEMQQKDVKAENNTQSIFDNFGFDDDVKEQKVAPTNTPKKINYFDLLSETPENDEKQEQKIEEKGEEPKVIEMTDFVLYKVPEAKPNEENVSNNQIQPHTETQKEINFDDFDFDKFVEAPKTQEVMPAKSEARPLNALETKEKIIPQLNTQKQKKFDFVIEDEEEEPKTREEKVEHESENQSVITQVTLTQQQIETLKKESYKNYLNLYEIDNEKHETILEEDKVAVNKDTLIEKKEKKPKPTQQDLFSFDLIESEKNTEDVNESQKSEELVITMEPKQAPLGVDENLFDFDFEPTPRNPNNVTTQNEQIVESKEEKTVDTPKPLDNLFDFGFEPTPRNTDGTATDVVLENESIESVAAKEEKNEVKTQTPEDLFDFGFEATPRMQETPEPVVEHKEVVDEFKQDHPTGKKEGENVTENRQQGVEEESTPIDKKEQPIHKYSCLFDVEQPALPQPQNDLLTLDVSQQSFDPTDAQIEENVKTGENEQREISNEVGETPKETTSVNNAIAEGTVKRDEKKTDESIFDFEITPNNGNNTTPPIQVIDTKEEMKNESPKVVEDMFGVQISKSTEENKPMKSQETESQKMNQFATKSPLPKIVSPLPLFEMETEPQQQKLRNDALFDFDFEPQQGETIHQATEETQPTESGVNKSVTGSSPAIEIGDNEQNQHETPEAVENKQTTASQHDISVEQFFF